MAVSRPPSCLLTRLLARASIVIVLALPGVSARAQSLPPNLVPSSLFAVETRNTRPFTLHDSSAPDTRSDDESEKHDRAFNITLGAFFTAASSDLAVSMYQIGGGSARERGFGSWWQDSPVVFATTKSAMTAVFAYGLQRVHKTRPKTAFVMGIAATAVESWLVVRSARLPQPDR